MLAYRCSTSGGEQKIEPAYISLVRVRCHMHNKTKFKKSSAHYSTDSLNGWWKLKKNLLLETYSSTGRVCDFNTRP